MTKNDAVLVNQVFLILIVRILEDGNDIVYEK